LLVEELNMRRCLYYLITVLLAFGLTLSSYSQSAKQRTFFIESQPDSPLLIRDLTATILPVNKYRISPKLEVAFYVENRSKKKIKDYQYQDPDENDLNYEDYNVRGFGGDLLPGESYLVKSTMTVEGNSLVYRIRDVKFEDGTSWKAKPFNAAKAKKSAPVIATVQKITENTKPKRILTREWSAPVFNDDVVKVINAEPQIIEGIKVQTRLHELKSELIDDVEFCPLPAEELEKIKKELPADIIYTEQNYIVKKFTTYEIKGRIFAYEIPYEAIDAETLYEIGVGFQSVYVDEDGSGYFKMRCSETELKSLPAWVKFQAGK
jgi:hypothetical protein